MKIKQILSIFIILSLLLSLVTAQNETIEPQEECGFLCKVWEFFWGSKENRAGQAWWDREDALVGGAITIPDSLQPGEKEKLTQNGYLNKGDTEWFVYKNQIVKVTKHKVEIYEKNGKSSIVTEFRANAIRNALDQKRYNNIASTPTSSPSTTSTTSTPPTPPTPPTTSTPPKAPKASTPTTPKAPTTKNYKVDNKERQLAIHESNTLYDPKTGEIFYKTKYGTVILVKNAKYIKGKIVPSGGYVIINTKDGGIMSISKSAASAKDYFGFDPSKPTEVKDWQKKQIKTLCGNNGNKCDKNTCPGSMSNGACVADGVFGPKSQALAIKLATTQRESQVKNNLGEIEYNKLKSSIDWDKVKKDQNVYPLKSNAGKVTVKGENIKTVEVEYKKGATVDKTKSYLASYVGGVQTMRQNLKQKDDGIAVINGNTVYIEPKDGDSYRSGKKIEYYANAADRKAKKVGGEAKVNGNEIIDTNYNKGTRLKYNPIKKERWDINGNTFRGKDCSSGNICFVETDGTVKRPLRNNPQLFVRNYEQTKTLGAPNLKSSEYYNQKTGRFERSEIVGGPTVVALQDKKEKNIWKYTGFYQVYEKGTLKGTYKKVGDQWVNAIDNTVCSDCNVKGSVLKKTLDTQYTWSVGSAAKASFGLQLVSAFTQGVKRFSALNQVLEMIPGWGDWMRSVDRSFSSLMGKEWFASSICGIGYDLAPEDVSMIKTPSGSYQSVASIQIEKSPDKSPILCQNIDGEQFCEEGQECINSLCYKKGTKDKPLEGYFYKISWGVAAPRDEKLTPGKNENAAVSFNVVLYGKDKSNPVYLYKRGTDVGGPWRLENGASKKDVLIKYSNQEIYEACIVWKQPPLTTVGLGVGKTQGAGVGGTAASFLATPIIGGIIETANPTRLDNVCFQVTESKTGQLKYEKYGDGSTTPAVTPESEISRNTNW